MSEITIGIISTLKFFLIGLFGFFYWFAGRAGTPKWIRRFLGSAIFSGGIILFSLWQSSYSHLLLLYPVTLSIGLILGYGKNSKIMRFWKKVFRYEN